MRPILRLIAALVLTAVCVIVAGRATAQSASLEVGWIYPNEGETFYAGPTSLVYKVPVRGWVSWGDQNPEGDQKSGPPLTEIQVTVDVFQGERSLGSLALQPDSDGAFERTVTANPHGSSQDFTIAFMSCGDDCHEPGDLDLAAGQLRLVLTAEAAGQRAQVERHVTVDWGQMVTVPVHVVQDGQPVEGIQVSAAARLYDWRTRSRKGISGTGGLASLELEVPRDAPARYLLQAETTLVDGVLYRGVSSQQLLLPAGATSAPGVVLEITAELGAIQGLLKNIEQAGAIPVWAVRATDGRSYRTQATAGAFTFQDLPIAEYLVAADEAALASAGFEADVQSVDLSKERSTELALMARPLEGALLQGAVYDQAGLALPFAWVSLDETSETRAVYPLDGTFTWPGAQEGSQTVIVHAPGYYSQARVIQAGAATGGRFELVRRPGTSIVPWGEGYVTLPPETSAQIEAGRIGLERGWIWGRGRGDSPLLLTARGVEIEIDQGDFALELQPGATGWLYLCSGTARARRLDGDETVDLGALEMLALPARAERLTPARLEPVAIHMLHTAGAAPVEEAWQPSLKAQMRDRLARLGVGAAQSVTSIVYTLVFLGTLLIPLGILRAAARRHKAARHIKSDQE